MKEEPRRRNCGGGAMEENHEGGILGTKSWRRSPGGNIQFNAIWASSERHLETPGGHLEARMNTLRIKSVPNSLGLCKYYMKNNSDPTLPKTIGNQAGKNLCAASRPPPKTIVRAPFTAAATVWQL
jgi:hypothetical protein